MSKRLDVLTWEEYYMATCVLASLRSKDPECQVGSCIVQPSTCKILGVGYNGFPRGCSDDEFPWSKDTTDHKKNKHLFVLHAEVNAILNCNIKDTTGCIIYCTRAPCNECAKIIIQSGIVEVIYMFDPKPDDERWITANMMFEAAHVKRRQYKGKVMVTVEINDVKISSV
jgi:dCMP deaminase